MYRRILYIFIIGVLLAACGQKALTIYEQHPDDERNHVILLDYAGTYAAQVAYTTEGSYDEALDFIHRAYDIAEKNEMKDMNSTGGSCVGAPYVVYFALPMTFEMSSIIPPLPATIWGILPSHFSIMSSWTIIGDSDAAMVRL